MPEADLSIISPAAAAASLALLWIAESLLPSFIEHRGAGRGVRWRNLFLAGLNILVAAGFAGLTLFVTNLSRNLDFGLLHQARSVLPDASAMTLLLVGASFLLLDLWGYVFHVLAHQVPWLWRFHALHHNANHFEVTLALRFHAVEIALQGLLSLPIYFLLGVGIQEILLYQLVLMPVAFFHHWNVPLPGHLDRILSWVVVTPGMHVVHHSRWVRETDSNYAPVFSFWDRLFGSYRWRERPDTVAVGLDGFDEQQIHTLGGMLVTGLRSTPSHPGERPSDELIPEVLVERDDRARGPRPLEIGTRSIILSAWSFRFLDHHQPDPNPMSCGVRPVSSSSTEQFLDLHDLALHLCHFPVVEKAVFNGGVIHESTWLLPSLRDVPPGSAGEHPQGRGIGLDLQFGGARSAVHQLR